MNRVTSASLLRPLCIGSASDRGDSPCCRRPIPIVLFRPAHQGAPLLSLLIHTPPALASVLDMGQSALWCPPGGLLRAAQAIPPGSRPLLLRQPFSILLDSVCGFASKPAGLSVLFTVEQAVIRWCGIFAVKMGLVLFRPSP